MLIVDGACLGLYGLEGRWMRRVGVIGAVELRDDGGMKLGLRLLPRLGYFDVGGGVLSGAGFVDDANWTERWEVDISLS